MGMREGLTRDLLAFSQSLAPITNASLKHALPTTQHLTLIQLRLAFTHYLRPLFPTREAAHDSTFPSLSQVRLIGGSEDGRLSVR